MLCNKRSHCNEEPVPVTMKSSPFSLQLWRLTTAKKQKYINNKYINLFFRKKKYSLGTSGSSRDWKEVHEVKIISLIIRFYLLFSFSFFDEYTVEFSRDSICESIIALTTRGRCFYIYLSSQFYLPMQQIATNIRHINKMSLECSINLENVKDSWTPKVLEPLL